MQKMIGCVEGVWCCIAKKDYLVSTFSTNGGILMESCGEEIHAFPTNKIMF